MRNAATSLTAGVPGTEPRFTVADRLARRLKDWFARDGYGSQAALVAFSQQRPGGARITRQNLSYFMNGHRVNPITLNDLDDIADYFRVSIGELFDQRPGELSGDEQRLLLAFRALPRPMREHVLALVEPVAGSPYVVSFRDRPQPVTAPLPKGRVARIASLASEEQRRAEAAKLRAAADEIDPAR